MKRLVVLLAVLVMLLGACTQAPANAPAGESQNEGGEAAVVTSERCGDPSKLSDSVSFYNWSEYIDPEILTMFEEECGVAVVYDTFSSNEDLLAKLQAGATGYDIIVPSDYMVTIMVHLGLLKELDHANIPNLANLAERFRTAPYDPGNKYSVAYQWGATGIGYNADVVTTPPDSLAVIFDPAQAAQYEGKISLLNDAREVIGAALKYLGYSINSTDPAQLEEAKQVLLAIKPYVLTFDSDTFGDLLVSGETALALGWNGTIYLALSENEASNLGFAIPQEGLAVFTDNLAVPASAPNPYTAEVLINYLLDPEIGAMITNYTLFPSPNEAALPFIADEIKNAPNLNPSEEMLANVEYIEDVGEATALYERIWTEIKAQ
jgi:spermidine/putrescine transport system substrate-binding protein